MALLNLPGLIDCHVHFREPGLTHKEDMESGARAAVAGGVTTVCDMPNTIPPTVTVEALAGKVRRAKKIKGCDIRFFFGITEPKNLIALRKIWMSPDHHFRELRARCIGVKLYLDHSTGNMGARQHLVEEAFDACAQIRCPVVCHCEDAEINGKWKMENGKLGRDVAAHSRARPPKSEEKAVRYAIELARRHGTKLHIAHLSTRQGVELVRAAKKVSLPVTCEVAPHHLFLTVDDYEALGSLAKINPPLRDHEHQVALWCGIADGTIDCIASDHAPHTFEEKRVLNWRDAPSGVSGVETMLPLLLTVAAGGWPHPNSEFTHSAFTYTDITRLCFENPDRIFNLGKKSPEDAGNSIEIDPEAEWVIHGKDLHSKCGWTPYEGWKVRGRVVRVRDFAGQKEKVN